MFKWTQSIHENAVVGREHPRTHHESTFRLRKPVQNPCDSRSRSRIGVASELSRNRSRIGSSRVGVASESHRYRNGVGVASESHRIESYRSRIGSSRIGVVSDRVVSESHRSHVGVISDRVVSESHRIESYQSQKKEKSEWDAQTLTQTKPKRRRKK